MDDNTKKTNAKVAQTKSKLRAAILEIIREKPADGISVTELCKKAKINRTTFYKYYSVPKDVIAEYGNEIVQSLYYEIALGRKFTGSRNANLEICKLYNDNRDILRYYTFLDLRDIPKLNRLFRMSKNPLYDEHEARLVFVSGGVSAILMSWAQNDFIQTPEEVAKIISTFTKALGV